LRWLVVQDCPCPRINANGGSLRWENDDGKLWDRYQNPATGLGSEFNCFLLSDTCPDPVPEDFNREHFAGYVPYSYTKPFPPPNGGTIQFRGADLGECSVKIGNLGAIVKVIDGIQRPGKMESALFAEQITPRLQAFIAENRDSLRAEAVAKVKARLVSEVAEKRVELDALEKLIATAKF
jgi:hypothetical protein